MQGQAAYSVITDYLGTPLQLHDGQGNVAWAAELSSYGQRRAQAEPSTDCPFRYQGQYEDAETGLYYNRFRYYDPESGQYISQDPIGLLGGMAAYAYVLDPNSWTDVLGLSGNPLIVIGEGQTRVNQIARALKKQGHTVRTITDDWAREFVNYPNYKPELHEAKSIDYNRRWINQRMDEGYDTYDAGGRGKSPFYRAEHEEIIKRGYDKHFRFESETGSKTRISRVKKCGVA